MHRLSNRFFVFSVGVSASCHLPFLVMPAGSNSGKSCPEFPAGLTTSKRNRF